MGKKEKAIDAYISKSADFAKPVLEHFRNLVHKTCPEVVEKIKWGFPHFDYKASPMCSMASFKQHCAIGFWKATLMKDAEKLLGNAKTEVSMGHFGRITSKKDLPADREIIGYIKQAMKLNDEGIKLSTKNKPLDKKEIKPPTYFSKALSKNKKALITFEDFSPGHKKEYINWIIEAKTEPTRLKRMETAILWLSEGKIKNWKYVK